MTFVQKIITLKLSTFQHFMGIFFEQKCFAQLFLDTFQLCKFWHQNIGEKCTCKMLMNLTPAGSLHKPVIGPRVRSVSLKDAKFLKTFRSDHSGNTERTGNYTIPLST
jgi:hypothetical protein